jgi:hypothetical protein
MSNPWDVRVDFNTYPGPDLVFGNARHAEPGVVVTQGSLVTLGDEDWGVVRAEIVQVDPTTGTFTARLLGEIVGLDDGAASATA